MHLRVPDRQRGITTDRVSPPHLGERREGGARQIKGTEEQWKNEARELGAGERFRKIALCLKKNKKQTD